MMKKLKCGDIVTFRFMNREFKGVVTNNYHDVGRCAVMRHNGETAYLPTDKLTPTGEHVAMAWKIF
jgi:hypothetical protein